MIPQNLAALREALLLNLTERRETDQRDGGRLAVLDGRIAKLRKAIDVEERR